MVEQATPRPPALPVNVAGLPADPALDAPHWVCWRWEPKGDRPGEWTKPLFNPRTGYKASHSNPGHWGPRAQALAGAARFGMDGIGFVPTPDQGIVGIDWDKCRDPDTDTIDPEALAWVGRFATYAEISPSGTGLRLWLRGTLPAHIPAGGTKRHGREVYAGKRYLTVTGQRLPGVPDTFAPAQAALDAFLAAYFPPPPPRAVPPRPTPRPVDKSDEDLLALALERSPTLARLLAGDYAEVGGDESAGDWRAAYRLAFWFGGDAAAVERVLESSALRREKWDERRGDVTWLRYTVRKACAERPDHYDPLWRPVEATFALGDDAPLPAPDDELAGLLAGLDRAELERWAIEQHRRRLAAEGRCQRQAQGQSKQWKVIRNPHLKTQKLPALAILNHMQASADQADADGWLPLYQPAIAERAGCGVKAVRGGEELLVAVDGIEREVRCVPRRQVDRDTGEVRVEPKKAVFVRFKQQPEAICDVLAEYEPQRPPEKDTWGGKREKRCPDHPDAPTYVKRSRHCSVCDHQIEELSRTDYRLPREDGAPIIHDDRRVESEDDGPRGWAAIMGVDLPEAGGVAMPVSASPAAPAAIPITPVLPAPAPPASPAGAISYSRAPAPAPPPHQPHPPPPRGRPKCMNRACGQPMPGGDTRRYCPACRADGWGVP